MHKPAPHVSCHWFWHMAKMGNLIVVTMAVKIQNTNTIRYWIQNLMGKRDLARGFVNMYIHIMKVLLVVIGVLWCIMGYQSWGYCGVLQVITGFCGVWHGKFPNESLTGEWGSVRSKEESQSTERQFTFRSFVSQWFVFYQAVFVFLICILWSSNNTLIWYWKHHSTLV